MSRFESLTHTLHELASAFQAELEAALSNVEVVSNMCGIVLLPNEMLTRVFECVVNGDSGLWNPTRLKAAVILSHVCRYFRDTALSCPQMWSNLNADWDDEVVASCLSRSKDASLEVELTIGFRPGTLPRELHFETHLLEILSHSNQWGRLDIKFVGNGGNERTPLNGSDIVKAFRSLRVPLLESLYVRNYSPVYSLHETHGEFTHWRAPSLRHVTSVYCFPLSLPRPGKCDESQYYTQTGPNQFCRSSQGTLKNACSCGLHVEDRVPQSLSRALFSCTRQRNSQAFAV